jgi:hypothetical protein
MGEILKSLPKNKPKNNTSDNAIDKWIVFGNDLSISPIIYFNIYH